MFGRRDDPKHGRLESVYSVLIGFKRHMVFDTPEGYLVACRSGLRATRVATEDVLAVEARHISCPVCHRRYVKDD